MQVSSDLPLTAISMRAYPYQTPELQMLLCLRWAKERLNDSKADSSTRLIAVFNDIGDYDARSRISGLNLNADGIESAARQLSLQATCRTGNRGLTRSFSVLASWAKVNCATTNPYQCLDGARLRLSNDGLSIWWKVQRNWKPPLRFSATLWRNQDVDRRSG